MFAFADASKVVAVEIVVDALTLGVVRAYSMVVEVDVDTVVVDDSVVAADDDDYECNCSTEVET